MGPAIAARLSDRGHAVAVWNRFTQAAATGWGGCDVAAIALFAAEHSGEKR